MNTRLFITCLGLLALAGCGTDESARDGADVPAAQAAPAAASTGKTAAALAKIETGTYALTVHRAIPFTPKDDPTGLFKLPDGYRFVVLDIEVENRGAQPLEMGSILLLAQVTDAAGTLLEGNMPALLAYSTEHPDPAQDAGYDAVWSMEFPAGESHRAIALGVQAPVAAASLTLAVPATANSSDMRKATFPVGE